MKDDDSLREGLLERKCCRTLVGAAAVLLAVLAGCYYPHPRVSSGVPLNLGWLRDEPLDRGNSHPFAGDYEAADAFARAVPAPDVEKLAEYVVARRSIEVPEEHRRTLAGVRTALEEGKPAEALKIAEGVEAPPTTVVGLRIAYRRGQALILTGKPTEAIDVMIEVSAAAERMGYLRLAADALFEAGKTSIQIGQVGDLAFQGALDFTKAGCGRIIIGTAMLGQSQAGFVHQVESHEFRIGMFQERDDPQGLGIVFETAVGVH